MDYIAVWLVLGACVVCYLGFIIWNRREHRKLDAAIDQRNAERNRRIEESYNETARRIGASFDEAADMIGESYRQAGEKIGKIDRLDK